MANRDLVKTASKVDINPQYDLSVADCYYLVEQIEKAPDRNRLCYIICTIFKFGYAMGERATYKELGVPIKYKR